MARAAEVAGWLAEAWQTGNPLAPFPPELAPVDRAAGEAVAAELVERLDLPVCGVRLLPSPAGGWLSAPLLAPRLLGPRTPVSLPVLRHARVSGAIIGVLAEPLGEGPPVFGALHPALDVAAQRYRDAVEDEAHLVADLAALGVIVAGRPWRGAPPAEILLRVGRAPLGRGGTAIALADLFGIAAAEARRWGGLPAGAVLALAGLGGAAPAEAGRWAVRAGPIGRASAELTP